MKKKFALIGILIGIIMGLSACNNSDIPAERTEEEIADFRGEFFFEVPEDFNNKEEADGATYYLHKEHPEKESNISVTIAENDDSFKFLSAKRFTNQIAKGLKENYGEKVTTTIVEEKYLEIDGRRVFMYQAKYEVAEQTIIQIHYVIENDEELIAVIFTERNEEGFLEAFKAAGESISFLETK